MHASNIISTTQRLFSIYGDNLTVVDMARPEMLHLIDAYWYQFPPMDPIWHKILGCLVAILGIVAVIGNGTVIYIFATTKELRTPSNLLVINLAISDFLMLSCMAPGMVINSYFETWIFGPFICQLYGFGGSLFGSTSIWTMVFIALDRYIVIGKGISAKPLTTKMAIFWNFCAWLMSIIWTVAPVLGWNRYVPEGNMTACGTDYLSKDWFSRSYIIAYSIFVYFLPLFMIIYCYWYIVKAVAVHERSMREQAKKMNVASLRSTEAQQTSAEFKLAKIALMTITLWFIAWTPYLIINYAGFIDSIKITPLQTIWSSIFAKASAVYNPIVYAISHPKYKQALEKKCPSLACASRTDDSVSQRSVATNITNQNKSITA